MKNALCLCALLACLVVVGCSSSPPAPLAVSPSGAVVGYDFILDTDDKALREGESPMYALLEYRADTKGYRLLAMSKTMMSFTRSNQEQLFITKGLTNVVPAWTQWQSQFDKDGSTGTRSNYRFRSQTFLRSDEISYQPERSRFGMRRMQGNGEWTDYIYLNVTELRKALTDASVLTQAREWLDGKKQLPSTGPKVTAMKLPDVVLAIESRAGGETGRYFFVPDTAATAKGEVIEIGSELSVERVEGLASRKRSAFQSLTHARLDSLSPPKPGERFGCAYFYVDVTNEVTNKKVSFCGYGTRDDGLWSAPLVAKSPSLGEVIVAELVGTRYDKNGKRVASSARLSMRFSGIEDYRLLSEPEAAKARASFR